MRISKLRIQGFRNFVDETIDLDDKTLIVGGNDTGKSNLLYALRILFDPSLSSRELELSSSDYCIYSSTGEIIITAWLEDVHEDCLLSAFQGAVKDGHVCVRYSLVRGDEYEIATGYDESMLETCNGRSYTRHLSLEYVGGRRDLATFLCRQQNKLLEIARDHRDDQEEAEDDEAIDRIQTTLAGLNKDISDLHYVSESLGIVNSEMTELSFGNVGYEARLVAGNTDASKLLDNLQLAYLMGDSPLVFGGDGRGNQLYFATWISEQKLVRQQEKVSVFAIEEPEAHLHPHQQRRLAEYLSSVVPGQVIVTTHSPQIAERFSNGRVLRLLAKGAGQGNTARGCNTEVDTALEKLGYRLNAISSEVFFSSGVLLVEGPSERIFYTALSKALNIDLDRHNISVLSVDGVGFDPYVRVCEDLGIPYAIRTDNDVFDIGTTRGCRLAGLQRLVDIAVHYTNDSELSSLMQREAPKLAWNDADDVPEDASKAREALTPALAKNGLFLSHYEDLEHDMAASAIKPLQIEHFAPSSDEKLVAVMQRRKAENMYSFMASNPNLSDLADDPLAEPLIFIFSSVSGGKK